MTSYRMAHHYVMRQRGRAADHPCAHCGRPAMHWAYDYEDDPTREVDEKGRVFGSPDHYLPLCVRCHKYFDIHPVYHWLSAVMIDSHCTQCGACPGEACKGPLGKRTSYVPNYQHASRKEQFRQRGLDLYAEMRAIRADR